MSLAEYLAVGSVHASACTRRKLGGLLYISQKRRLGREKSIKSIEVNVDDDRWLGIADFNSRDHGNEWYSAALIKQKTNCSKVVIVDGVTKLPAVKYLGTCRYVMDERKLELERYIECRTPSG